MVRADTFGYQAIQGADILGYDAIRNGDLFGAKRLEAPAKQKKSFELLPADMVQLGMGNNLCILLIGRRGHGKTAIQTAITHTMLKKYQRAKFPGRLYSNYRMKFFRKDADGRPYDLYSPMLVDLISDFPPWLQKGFMALDEVQAFASARRSMSKSNLSLSLFLTQMRHRDIETCWTTQFPQVIDSQALLQVDLFVRVNTVARWPANRSGNSFPKVMDLTIFDYWGQFTGKDFRKTWPPQPEDADARRRVFMPLWYANQYNTKEIITSTYMDKETREAIMRDEGQLDADDSQAFMDAMKEPMRDAGEQREEQQHSTSGEDLLAAYIQKGNGYNRTQRFRLDQRLDRAREVSKGAIQSIADLAIFLTQLDPRWDVTLDSRTGLTYAQWSAPTDESPFSAWEPG